MPRFVKTLQFQLGAALLSLLLLFAYFSWQAVSALDEQRIQGALLRLAAELRLTQQSMAMRAMNYIDNAPKDETSYQRDLRLYYQDLRSSAERFDQVCGAFSSGRFAAELSLSHEFMAPRLSAQTQQAAQELEGYWRGYQRGLQQKLGPEQMPRLESAAQYVLSMDPELARLSRKLIETLEQDARRSSERINRLIRTSLAAAMLLAAGIMVWLYLGMLRPLRAAVAGFRSVANGDFGHKVPVQADNEIGWLAQSFNLLSQRLDSLFRLTTTLQQGSDLDETLAFVNANVPELLPLDWVGVLFVSGKDWIQLERVYSDGRPVDLGRPRFPLRDTLLEQCLHSGSLLHIPDVQELASSNPDFAFLRILAEQQRRDAIFLPLNTQSPLPGVLVFSTRLARAYRKDHLELLSNLALLIAHSFGRTLRLAEQARLAAIGQFVSGIVHELRNPLATVSLAMEYLAKVDLPEASAKRALLAAREAARMGRLLEEILLYSKPISLQPAWLHLTPLLNELLDSQQDRLRERGIGVERNESPADLALCADRDRLTQMLLNLLINAIEAAPTETRIGLHSSLGEGDEVRIEISNRSAPLNEEQRARLFDPFFTTKPGGSGLGLPIVRRLAELHGGSIEFSQRDQTISFVLRLPLRQPDCPPATPAIPH